MRFLPLDYAVRNLGRRPLRTSLTALSSLLVVALVVATASFARGLGRAFSGAGDPQVAVLVSKVAEGDLVRSSVSAGAAELVAASVPGVRAASGEIHMGTRVRLGAQEVEGEADYAGFVRGVPRAAYAVHERVVLLEGRLPRTGEVLVGRLAARQMGAPEEALAIGRTLRFESGSFEVVGRFAAPGTTIEGELWTPVAPLRGLARRDDSSGVFVAMAGGDFARLELFTKRRLDLELEMIPSVEYYRDLAAYFRPIQALAWGLAVLVGLAALLGGANTMNAAVADRVRELATLRAVGYTGAALVSTLAQESAVVACVGGLLGTVLARALLEGASFRIAMSAFALEPDAPAVLFGLAASVLLGVLGTVPAAWRALRLPISEALNED